MQYENKFNLPDSWYELATQSDYTGKPYDLERLSASGLMTPPRIRILLARHHEDVVLDVSKNSAAIFGNAVHALLGKLPEERYITNLRMERRWYVDPEEKSKIITGEADVIDKQTMTIEDYKFIKVASLSGRMEHYTAQLNTYAWLAKKTRDMDIHHLALVVYFTDWSQAQQMRDPYGTYPEHNPMVVEIKLFDHNRWTQALERRIRALLENETKPDDEIELCTPEERWAHPDCYAIHKIKQDGSISARAVSIQNNTEHEARERIKEYSIRSPKTKYKIIKRPGLDVRCTQWCPVNKFCSFWKEKYGQIRARKERNTT